MDKRIICCLVINKHDFKHYNVYVSDYILFEVMTTIITYVQNSFKLYNIKYINIFDLLNTVGPMS